MIVDWGHLFCDRDDFCRGFEPEWQRHLISAGVKRRARCSALSLSEVMTLIIAFHLAHYRNFKHFYTDYIPAITASVSATGQLLAFCGVDA
jgi:hypothetical protein